ncbi:uncharacterized protein PRCAT00004111001 [Priceomyces carsonii]|uniref:uncharacterized protein n=1 Tax=Priceomyces carsonii TaxID=28549 RepID=UPI002EDAC683|nr:unnamed protein product [Priceomyces carsonii]
MRMWIRLVASCIIFATAWAFENGGEWENLHYKRVVDLSKSYTKESINIVARNEGQNPTDEYTFTVNDGFGAFGEVSVISFVLMDHGGVALESLQEAPKVYKLKLPYPVAPNNEINIKVQYAYRGANSPFPSELSMSDVQTLLVRLNKFAYSPYTTKDYSLLFTGVSKGQEMELNFVNKDELTPDLPSVKPRVEEKALVYGPLDFDLEPFTIKPMGLLYDHNRPLSRAVNLNRSVWIPASEVAKLPVEESYDLVNDAAELNTGFLRLDWMKGRYDTTRNHWAISHLDIPLKANGMFHDFYYTDLVGVVSTFNFVQDHLLLQPRFPLFGGWHFNFTLGWNYAISDFVHQVNNEPETYILRIPLVNSVRDITYDNVYLSFYLPENAEFLNVSSPIDFELLTVTNEHSYLDVAKGHVKVTLHYKNLFDDVHNLDALIMYRSTSIGYMRRILKVAGWIFISLLSYYFLSLLNFSIESKKPKQVDENETEEKSK